MNFHHVRIRQQRIYIIIKLLFITTDLLINSFHERAREEILALILTFIVQDLCIIFSVTLIVFSFLSAFVVQADSLRILFKIFVTPIILCIAYLLMTVILQALILMYRWSAPLTFEWSNSLVVVNSIQKLLAVVHYYFYKRTALKLSDPSYYFT